MRQELYFCLNLTENEHYIVEDMIRDMCVTHNIKFHYYRKCKEGHVPMIRECKVEGASVNYIKRLLVAEGIDKCIVPNPWNASRKAKKREQNA